MYDVWEESNELFTLLIGFSFDITIMLFETVMFETMSFRYPGNPTLPLVGPTTKDLLCAWPMDQNRLSVTMVSVLLVLPP